MPCQILPPAAAVVAALQWQGSGLRCAAHLLVLRLFVRRRLGILARSDLSVAFTSSLDLPAAARKK